jgi:two-component system, chemotaxis family, sensor kinase CheA
LQTLPQNGSVCGEQVKGNDGVFASRRFVLKHQQDEWELIWRINRENAALQSLIKQVADRSSGDTSAAAEHLARQVHVSRWIVGGGILTSLVLGLFAVAFMNRRVAIPIEQMGELMRRMERHDIAMNAMLDSLGQGLLFFDGQGICSPIFSKACLKLLETTPAEKHIGDVLRLPEKKRLLLMTVIDLLFKNKLPLGFEELSKLVPDRFEHSEGLAVSLSYRPINGLGGQLSHVLVVATDRTKEREAELLLRENQTAAERVLRITHNRNHFIRFVQNFRAFFSGGFAGGTVDQQRRDVHTFKGAADTFHMGEVAQGLHELESLLMGKAVDVEIIFLERGPVLLDMFERSLASVREFLGEEFLLSGSVRAIREDKLAELGQRLLHCPGDKESVRAVYDWYLEEIVSLPIFAALKEFMSSVENLGERFGKPVHPCRIRGDNFRIVPNLYDPLFASLVHLARNIIDHGMESQAIRKSQGKDPYGQVTVETETFKKDGQDWFAISIGDDGAGFDISALRRKFAENPHMRDVAAADDETVLQSVLEGGVSTRNEVSLLAGRGVGLNAVRVEAKRLGGSVKVFSEKGRGAKLRIELPYLRRLS